jgi:hypothetical protein
MSWPPLCVTHVRILSRFCIDNFHSKRRMKNYFWTTWAYKKLYLCFYQEDVLGSGDTVPCILNIGTRWRWVVSFTPRPIYSRGKSSWYPLQWRLGGSPEPVWTWWEKSRILPGMKPQPPSPWPSHCTELPSYQSYGRLDKGTNTRKHWKNIRKNYFNKIPSAFVI